MAGFGSWLPASGMGAEHSRVAFEFSLSLL
jgi:hypothetical protein